MYVILTITFLLLLVLFVFYGWGIVMRRSDNGSTITGDRCSLCREHYPKELLIEREIGDYKVYFFCHECIEQLVNDARRMITSDHQ